MTLWAAVVAERLGFDEEEALTIGQAVAGLDARAKGLRLGEALPEVKAAMEELAGSLSHTDLVHRAYDLYEQFRSLVPAGVRGWGAPGDLPWTRCGRWRACDRRAQGLFRRAERVADPEGADRAP